MTDPINAVRRAEVPNLPAEVPPPAVAPAEPEAPAPVVAANRAARERFFEALGTMEGLSPRFLDYVRERLGLEGRIEIASQPLEEREVNEIMTEAKRQAAAGALQVSEAVCKAVAREIEEAFEKGERASFGDILNELEAVMPGEMLPKATEMALMVFREEMKTHLREVRGLLLVEAARNGNGQACGETFAWYADSVVALVRRAAVEPQCDPLAAFQENAASFALTLTVVKSVAQLLTMAVRLRSIILRCRLECAMADAKAKAALADLKIRELVSEIAEAFRELDAEIKRLQESIRKDSSLVVALQAVATEHLESEKREWTKSVAGFEARMERLREERREEIVDGLPFETEMGPSVTKCD